MRKIVLIMMILTAAVTFSFAQVTDIDSLEESFKDFSNDIATGLPYASTLGLNWSNAYMGKFPHFGIGLTTGVASLPSEAFKGIADEFGYDLPDIFGDVGIPLPAYTLDARIGIPLLPIDAGVKFGIIDPSWTQGLGVGIDYLLVGGDVRWGILEDKAVFPALSVGLGYNYIKGGVTMEGVIDGENIDISSIPGYTQVELSDTDLFYSWNSHVIDAKVQVSKKLFIITPSFGLGYSHGFSQAGGGLSSNITVDGSDPDAAAISAIESATGFELDDTSLSLTSEVNGGSLRAFGGFSLNILIMRLDFNAMYNLNSNLWGGSFNIRAEI